MKYGNSIPHKTHNLICLNQLECNNVIKNHQENQKYFYIIHKVGIWDFLFLRILAHFSHLYTLT